MTRNEVSRRSLLAGLGAVAGGAAVLGAAGPADAAADPRTPNGAGALRPAAPPPGLPTPISSPPAAGVSYLFRDFEEFIPEDFSNGRTYTGTGGITSTSFALFTFTTSFDLPPGAVLRDIEWYVYNSSGSPATALLRIWTAGQPTFRFGGVDGSIASTSALTATRFLVPDASNGPFPSGHRALATIYLSNGIVVNGVRLGLTRAPTSPVLLPSPVRVYDSRTSDGPLASGQTRTLSLASRLPVGALGAIVNVTVTGTVVGGYVSVHAAGTATPATSSVNWFASGQTLANQATTAVSGSRSIAVTAGGGYRTQYLVDLLGYLV